MEGQLGRHEHAGLLKHELRQTDNHCRQLCDLLSIEMKTGSACPKRLDSIRDLAKGMAQEVAKPSAHSGISDVFRKSLLASYRTGFVQAQRTMIKSTAAVTSANLRSDGHVSTNTFRTKDILSKITQLTKCGNHIGARSAVP
jgi:hypothetical protein